jgi:hypothetical protein
VSKDLRLFFDEFPMPRRMAWMRKYAFNEDARVPMSGFSDM